MTRRTEDILKQVENLQEDEKYEIFSSILHNDLYNKIPMIHLENNIQFVVEANKMLRKYEFSETSQKNLLNDAIKKLKKYNTFEQIQDPILWQQQIRDDR